MKKRIKYLFIIFLLLVASTKVQALEVSKNDLTLEKGGHENIELYVNTENNITQVDFTLVFSTYDIPANFFPADGLSDGNPNGIKHSITFSEAKTGKILLGSISISVRNNATDKSGTVNIHTASAKTETGETINLKVQNINVKVGTPQVTAEKPKEEIDKNLLDKIESNLVKIELKKDVFEYNVDIKEGLEELDLKPVAKDSKSKIDISTQKISELKDKSIIITVKNDDVEQKYIIKVNVKENTKKESNIEVDKEEFKADKSYKGKWIIMIVILGVIFVANLFINKKK